MGWQGRRAGPAPVAVLVMLVAATVVAAGQTSSLPDVRRLGPQIGDSTPNFSLQDQRGQTRTLTSLMGPNGLMLVFVQSADWSPVCRTQLADLQSQLPEITRLGLGLAAISDDAMPILSDFARRRAITFPLLSDSRSQVIRRYGIFDTTVAENNRQSYGVPFPGTFIVNTKGIVQRRFFEQPPQERVTVRSQLLALGATLSMPVTTITAPHARITSFVSNASVSAGARFSVVLDIVPAAGVHIYAPGVTGYKSLTLAVADSPAAHARETHMPAPKDYFFMPLNEHVPVFEGPFRVTQDLVIDASPGAQGAVGGRSTLTIHATLDYQACDDRVCFPRESLPLSWSVVLMPLDNERALVPAAK